MHVQQEVHDSVVDVDRDTSPERSFKLPALAPMADEGHTVPNVPRFP